MASFAEDTLEKKLADLNNSQQSIQQLSLWVIHHRKHYSKIVSIWYKELHKTSNSRKLTFLYLANDVVQNSRKKAPELSKEFGGVMKKVMEHLHKSKMDDKTKGSISRLIQIWQERQIFDPKTQSELTKIWNSHLKRPKVEDNKSDEPGTPPGTPPLPKKIKRGNFTLFYKLEIKEILRRTNFLGIKVSKNAVLTHDGHMMKELRNQCTKLLVNLNIVKIYVKMI